MVVFPAPLSPIIPNTCFFDSDREKFWKAKDKLIGQIVEVRADQITQNQDSNNEWSLRFPRFLRFRGFEIGEKI